MREIGGKQVDNKRKEREMGIWLTSDSSSFASPSWRAGRPLTSTQLLMTATSSSSLGGWPHSLFSLSFWIIWGEQGRITWSEGQPKYNANENWISKDSRRNQSKRKKIYVKLPVSVSPSTSPSGSSSFSFNCPTIKSKCARFAARKTSY